MHEDPDQVPLPGKFLGGVTVSEAIGMQGEARAFEGGYEDDLRLDVDRYAEEPKRPFLRPPSRSAVITLWAVGLIAALGIAAYVQVSQQRTAAAVDAAPPPAEAAPVTATTPIPPEPVVSSPAPIAAEAKPAAADTPAAASAAAAPQPAPPKVAAKDITAPKAASSKAEKADAPPTKAQSAKKLPPDIVRLRSQLNHAYNQAVKAGTPRAVLKARREEWTVLYAKAKRTSPEAVAALYRTRTAELEAIVKRQKAAGAN